MSKYSVMQVKFTFRSMLLAVGVVVALIVAVTLYSQGRDLLHSTTGLTGNEATNLPNFSDLLFRMTRIAIGIR